VPVVVNCNNRNNNKFSDPAYDRIGKQRCYISFKNRYIANLSYKENLYIGPTIYQRDKSELGSNY